MTSGLKSNRSHLLLSKGLLQMKTLVVKDLRWKYYLMICLYLWLINLEAGETQLMYH